MSEGASQRGRTGPYSLISRQLIRAALGALINGRLRTASGREGVSYAGRGAARIYPGIRPRGAEKAAAAVPQGPAPAPRRRVDSPCSARPGRAPRSGALPLSLRNCSEPPGLLGRPRPGASPRPRFGVSACWLDDRLAALEEDGREGPSPLYSEI